MFKLVGKGIGMVLDWVMSKCRKPELIAKPAVYMYTVLAVPGIGSEWVVDTPDPFELEDYVNTAVVRVLDVRGDYVKYRMGDGITSVESSCTLKTFNAVYITLAQARKRLERTP